jgi:hypothetical protein
MLARNPRAAMDFIRLTLKRGEPHGTIRSKTYKLLDDRDQILGSWSSWPLADKIGTRKVGRLVREAFDRGAGEARIVSPQGRTLKVYSNAPE